MDPLSQAVTGAALAGSFSLKAHTRKALLLGALSGMAPDLDILIRSQTDPLLALEYHRHFTHALPFSPIGALICAAFFYLFPPIRNFMSFGRCYLYCLLGYFTHGLLDASTGYGTHLFWPFTNTRESWNIIGIIDLFYTLPVLLLLIIAAYRKCRNSVFVAVIWILAYLSLGFYQQHRATEVVTAWLDTSKHHYSKLAVRPTISNLWLWRIIYRDEKTDLWQTHALYLPFWSNEAGVLKGETALTLDRKWEQAYPADTVTGQDIRLFEFFSDGYLSMHLKGTHGFYIGDIRYGLTPDSGQPLWGIEPTDDPNSHVIWHPSTRGSLNWYKIEKLLKGEGFTPIR